MKRIAIAVALVLGIAAGEISASVIQFAEPEVPYTLDCGRPASAGSLCDGNGAANFEVGGLRFSHAHVVNYAAYLAVLDLNRLPYIVQMMPTLPAALYPMAENEISHITRVDGGEFSLTSMMFASANSGAYLWLTGYRDGVQVYHIQSPYSLINDGYSETYVNFVLDEMIVDRVDYYRTGYLNGISLIDNLEYDLMPTADSVGVPSPATAALLAIGLLGLAWRRYAERV